MKKIWLALAAGLALGVPATGAAMDSATLLGHPAQYRVIYADGEKAIYADVSTIRAMQSRDFPASIENVFFTMYVEKYVSDPDAMAYQMGHIVTEIQQYDAAAYGNRKTDTYRLDAKLRAVYDGDGKPLDDASREGQRVKLAGDDMYYSLTRVAHMPRTEERQKEGNP